MGGSGLCMRRCIHLCMSEMRAQGGHVYMYAVACTFEESHIYLLAVNLNRICKHQVMVC